MRRVSKDSYTCQTDSLRVLNAIFSRSVESFEETKFNIDNLIDFKCFLTKIC